MGKHLGVAYNLRLPPELKEKIAESAKEHNRSMNADIVARLEQTFINADEDRIYLFNAIKDVKKLMSTLQQQIDSGAEQIRKDAEEFRQRMDRIEADKNNQ
ncbi:MAG: Arc family DNA-binding protein [Acinetobacter venetianus]|uniref:Arc family DNA-binding protein n=1 Tax=Acinetobacter venetianus TaxID=52133 RepID=UPI003C71455B